MTEIEDNYKKTLHPSGIVILTEKMNNVRAVSLGFWIKIGSRYEPANLSGISHFLEHLLFKGSEKFTSKMISEIFDSMGGVINALTGKEYTCFYTRLIDEKVERGFEVLADMLQKPEFLQKEIKKEINVVLEEISLYEDSPDDKIHDFFIENLLGNHPLGKTILGKNESVESFDVKKSLNFFKEHYFPKNMIIAASGNVSHDLICELVTKYFANNLKKVTVKEKIKHKVKAQNKIYFKDTEQVHMCYGTKAFPADNPDRYVLTVLDTILGGGMSFRLFQEIREKRGLAYSVYSYHSLYSDTGIYAVYAGTRPDKAKEVLAIIKKEMFSLTENVGKEELERAKDHLKGHLVLSLESSSARMSRLGKSELIYKEIISIDELIKRVEKVTREDIVRVASDLFQPDKMVLTTIGPLTDKQFTQLTS
ncbi:MAG: insulinase family protein [Actinomycetia bacterium]|nr:insulinase family protein [Actinomycetes bacterium]